MTGQPEGLEQQLARRAAVALRSYRLGADVADVTADGHVVYALDEHGGVYALQI